MQALTALTLAGALALTAIAGAPVGGTRVYQAFHRNSAPGHCTPDRFNLSNACAIAWTP